MPVAAGYARPEIKDIIQPGSLQGAQAFGIFPGLIQAGESSADGTRLIGPARSRGNPEKDGGVFRIPFFVSFIKSGVCRVQAVSRRELQQLACAFRLTVRKWSHDRCSQNIQP